MNGVHGTLNQGRHHMPIISLTILYLTTFGASTLAYTHIARNAMKIPSGRTIYNVGQKNKTQTPRRSSTFTFALWFSLQKCSGNVRCEKSVEFPMGRLMEDKKCTQQHC